VGSKGRRLAVDAGADDADIIETANEVGWMLEQAAERGIGRVTVRGHVGKLVKLAAGVFDTHSRVADARLVTLAAYAGALGVPADEIRALLGMTTADLAATRLLELGRRDVLREVAAVGARAATQRYGIEVRIVLLDRDGNVLAQAVPRDAVTPSAGTATDAPADGGVS
jgi:cobalt-precorrin-5B (C1)-methyltransferase